MRLPDVEPEQAKIKGKTGIRVPPLADESPLAIQRYMRRWSINFGPLWHEIRHPMTWSGVLQITLPLQMRGAVTESGVLQIVKRLCHGWSAFQRRACVQTGSCGSDEEAWDERSDILEVMGWKDVTMLRRYTAEVASELAQEAHRKFNPTLSLQP